MGLSLLEESKKYLDSSSSFSSKEELLEHINSSKSPFPINSKLLFSLYYTCEVLDKEQAKILSYFYLTKAQLEILKTLYISKEKALIQSDIEKMTFSAKATISSQLKTLEKKDFILRNQNPKNKRQNIVSLTKKGEKYLKDVSEKLTPLVLNPLITEEDTKQLMELLQKIRINATSK